MWPWAGYLTPLGPEEVVIKGALLSLEAHDYSESKDGAYDLW